MQTYSFAQSDFLENINDLESDVNQVTSHILTESNTSTPMILSDDKGNVVSYLNIEDEKIKDSISVKKLINRFKNENSPIEVRYKDEVRNIIYYGNSPLINKLKYYPLALLLIIFLFGAVVYFFYRSSKIATQNKLWTGMAKETAHQIGTPLSS